MRTGLVVVLAIGAVLLGGAWWVVAGLLAGEHSSCGGELPAQIAFGAANLGLLLALLAVGAALGPWKRAAEAMLAIYAALFGVSVVLGAVC